MNIVLDAHMLGEQEGGNETYVAGLLRGFESLALGPQISITTLLRPGYHPPQRWNASIKPAWLSTSGNFRRLFYEIPSYCRTHHPDLLHVTYNASPFLSCPIVVTVHDVIFKLYPQYFSPRVRLLLSTLLPLTMLRSKVIITVSDISRRDIEQYYPFTRGKIHVIPEAAGPVVDSVANLAVARDISGNRPFILAVGTLQPRKNLDRLVDAYIQARVMETISERLIIVGRAAWQHSQLMSKVSQCPYQEDIVFTGYLEDAVVAALYRTCSVFVYPSIYEGFGLPVLEAMACRAPVITTKSSSMAEVAGDAALLIDSQSATQLQQALELVLHNPSLADEMRAKGESRSRLFSWRKVAESTIETYSAAVAVR